MAPSGTIAVNGTLYKNLPYDPVADFIPLVLAAQTPFVLVVNPELPVHSVPEFIKWAKAQGAPISFATVGPGLPHHLFAELFRGMTGIAINYVPYRGSLPSLNDVVAGHVPAMFVDLGPAVGLLKAGKVRPLGVSPKTRVAAFPDIPTIAEQGLADFDAASWQMLVAPSKTPRPVVEKLHAELTGILALPEIREQIVTGGMVPVDNPSVAGLQAFVQAEVARWGKVVRDAGIAGSQ
jgi:tripartite-type tricarboxylate transporter receptor subunit TctC